MFRCHRRTLISGRFYAPHAFFARTYGGRGTFVATALAFEVLLYFLATIFSHHQLFQKSGRFYFRLANCLYCLGCYTAQSTDYSLHPVSGTVSLRLPPVHVTAKLSSTRVIELSRTCQHSLLRYARALPLSGFLAPVQRYSVSLLCHSQPDGFTLSPLRHFCDCLLRSAHSTVGYVSHQLVVPGR